MKFTDVSKENEYYQEPLSSKEPGESALHLKHDFLKSFYLFWK